MTVDETLSFMQRLYTETWKDMYEWDDVPRKPKSFIPSVESPQHSNGELLHKLGRSTMFDFIQHNVAHHIRFTKRNVVVVMPRTVSDKLPSAASVVSTSAGT